ncbi:MAG: hypothetical protein ABWZ25_05965 [Chitinophagaceae bacterium]
MKFSRLVIVFLCLLVVVAWLTKPGPDAFREFYQSELSSDGPPVIAFKDKFLYSSVEIDFYKPARMEGGEPLKAVSVKKQSYLGLFGRFWKL